MNEGLRFKGHWTIEIRRKGKLIKVLEIDNQLTNLYRNSVLNQLKGNAFTSLDILYFALGTDSTPATADDTQLGAEIFRSVPTSKTIENGYVQSIWVIPTNIANTRLREVGVFAGNATSTADSGMLLSRIVIDIDKTSNMEITFIRKDYVTI